MLAETVIRVFYVLSPIVTRLAARRLDGSKDKIFGKVSIYFSAARKELTMD